VVGRRLDPASAPWALHWLRHAGIAHALDDGWTVAQIGAKSWHSSLRALEVDANPSAAAIRAMTDALGGQPSEASGGRKLAETA
jgi:hypothetical protein